MDPNGTPICVRDAEPADFEGILPLARALHDASHYRAIPFDRESVMQTLHACRSYGLLVIAEDEGTVVGVVGGVEYGFPSNHNVRLGTEVLWWVDPGYRSHGIGRRLLKGIERRAHDLGLHTWTMTRLESVEPHMTDALYRSAGYTPRECLFSKEV